MAEPERTPIWHYVVVVIGAAAFTAFGIVGLPILANYLKL